MIHWIELLKNSTWKIDDLKVESTVQVYLPTAKKVNYEELKSKYPNLSNKKNEEFYKITNGFLLFEFNYRPVLEISDFRTIVNNPQGYFLLERLYDTFLNVYFHLYKDCIYWYKENTAVKGVFDYEEQVERYENFIVDKYSCPILKQLDLSCIQNLNFKNAFVHLLKKSHLEKITSLNFLLYGTEKIEIGKTKYTAEAKDVFTTLNNIVYRRFKHFLDEELKLNSNKKRTLNPASKNISLNTYFAYPQLKLLHKSLNNSYIKEIKIENFVNCLSGKKVDPSLRIVWKKSKRQAYYLFSLISPNFQISKLNASVIKPNYLFDSNDYNKNAYYQDLIDILYKIDPSNKNFATLTKK